MQIDFSSVTHRQSSKLQAKAYKWNDETYWNKIQIKYTVYSNKHTLCP